MAEQGIVTVYREFPNEFNHPRFYDQITQGEFSEPGKQQVEKAEGICSGHRETNIYFVDSPEKRKYIVEVVLDKGSFYIITPCSYTPTIGMDKIDGNLAQDAEEWILVQNLNYQSDRLELIFGDKDKIPSNDYLSQIGFPQPGQESPIHGVTHNENQKKWWKFW